MSTHQALQPKDKRGKKRKRGGTRWTKRKRQNKSTKADKIHEYLSSLYDTPGNPGAYGSLTAFWQAVQDGSKPGITKPQVRKFLDSNTAYTTHRLQRKKFKTHRYYVGNLQQLQQLDLADVSRFKDYNDKITFLLVQIDCFSRFIKVQPLLQKTGKEMVGALEKIYPDPHSYTSKAMSDQGVEFTNKQVQEFFNERYMKFYTVTSNQKAAYAEFAVKMVK